MIYIRRYCCSILWRVKPKKTTYPRFISKLQHFIANKTCAGYTSIFNFAVMLFIIVMIGTMLLGRKVKIEFRNILNIMFIRDICAVNKLDERYCTVYKKKTYR